MRRTGIIVFVIVLLLGGLSAYLYFRNKVPTFTGAPGQTVELVFELEKNFEYGEYYFDLDNGKTATYPLCFCLTERNTYPPDCNGDVKYIYNNAPGIMCMPLHIAKGKCSAKEISSMGHATAFIIPLEYSWTKPVERIVMGIRVPPEATAGARLSVAVNLLKKNDQGKLELYRSLEQAIKVGK